MTELLTYFGDAYNLPVNLDDTYFKTIYQLSPEILSKFAFNTFSSIMNTTKFSKLDQSYYYDEYNNNLNIFKKNEEIVDRDYYFTSFYKLNPNILTKYFDQLNDIITNKHLYNENTVNDIEVIVPNRIKNKKNVDNLGITQIFSVWNKIDNI
jgi:hypothetical protein